MNFSDPLGLKVKFEGKDSTELKTRWEALEATAANAMLSQDATTSHAGALIWFTMNAIEGSPQTVPIYTQKEPTWGSTSAETDAFWRGTSLMSLVIRINPDAYFSDSPVGRENILAHEAGTRFCLSSRSMDSQHRCS